jgi:putative peptidoglycan lipid II flippase
MQSALRSAALITVFTLAGQTLGFLTQVAAAAIFGASAEMDAFLAATSLPNYVATILLGSLSYVFIPFFVSYRSRGSESDAYALASALLNNCIVVLLVITLVGIFYAKSLLRLTAPGLTPEAMELAVKVSVVSWPIIIASGAFYVLISVCQAEKKFVWQAVVPLLGGLINLILMWVLAKQFGVVSLAIGAAASSALQVALLANVLAHRGRYHLKLNWSNADLRQIFQLLAPLVLVAAVTKSTPLIDRYLASDMDAGSISYLNYATKIVALMAVLISAGGSTVIFPKLAKDATSDDMTTVRDTLQMGVRLMWFAVAPIVAVGVAVATPAVSVLLKYGRFGETDVLAVASLLKLYLFAMIGMSVGAVTAKGFYVLKDTKSLTVFGIIETIAYVVYTCVLATRLGVAGVAIAGVIYFNLSIVWQLLILNKKLGSFAIRNSTISSVKILIAAVISGGVAFLVGEVISTVPLKVATGVITACLAYFMVLRLLRSEELTILLGALKSKSQPVAEA